jgi:hypothetical protein
MDEFGNLTDAEIFQIGLTVRDKDTEKDEITEVFKRYCELHENNEKISFEMQKFIYECLKRYLDGDNLEASFGLKRRKGVGKNKDDRNTFIAADILSMRLDGCSFENAVFDVSEKYGVQERQISNIWSKNKQNGLIHLRMKRALDMYPWTDEEKARLFKILGKEEWTKF